MTQITQIGWITDLLELLVDVALPLKVGWTLWLAAGIALFAWSWHARLSARLFERPVAKVPFVSLNLRS